MYKHIKKINFLIKILIFKKFFFKRSSIKFVRSSFYLKNKNEQFSNKFSNIKLKFKKVFKVLFKKKSTFLCLNLNFLHFYYIILFSLKFKLFKHKYVLQDFSKLFVTHIFFKHRNILKFLNIKNFYFAIFLENFFRKRIYFNIKKLNNFLKSVTKIKYFRRLIKKFKRYLLWIRFDFALDLMKVFFLSLYLKDSSFFLTWLGRTLYFIKVKPMKKALSFIRSLIRKYFLPFIKIFRIVGLYFDARGKFGLSGTAKKKHYKVIIGKTSFSSKQLRVNLAKEPIITQTGVLGCTFCIFF